VVSCGCCVLSMSLYSRWVDAGDGVALARLDPFIVDKQASRLGVLDTVGGSELDRESRHGSINNAECCAGK
jgi:hypothetical protein